MANFIINQTASEIQQILNKADTPDTTPTSNSQNLVESGGVKTYVDTQVSQGASITTNSFAPSALEDSTEGMTATDAAVPTSKAVKDYVDAIELKKATLTLPTTSYSSSTNVVNWVESDPNDFLNYTSNVNFALKVNTAAKAGLYSATLKLTANDSDTGSDAFELEFYKNDSLQSGMTIDLNNAQGTDGGFRTATWIFAPSDTWYLRVREYNPNTVLTLSNTTITVTKIT